MAERTLIARVQPDTQEPETLVVASPVVGIADGVPRAGTYLNPFDKVLTLRILNERHTLRLPRDVQGRIVEAFIPNAYTAVAFNAALLRIDPRAAQAGDAGAARGEGTGAATGDAADANLIRVTAPSEGIFYRRGSPDAPAYVEVGSTVSSGVVLGLVEVMKCFNQITYGGPGFPERGEIVKILAEDSGEVQFGQELFWVKPIA
jgi:acetyl-CoA carboxylase biotin carboxyl carrier protein